MRMCSHASTQLVGPTLSSASAWKQTDSSLGFPVTHSMRVQHGSISSQRQAGTVRLLASEEHLTPVEGPYVHLPASHHFQGDRR